MDSVEFGSESTSDIWVFGIKGFFECIFGLSQGLCLSFVGFDIGSEIVEFFLSKTGSTSTVESRFLSDIEVINILDHIISYREGIIRNILVKSIKE